MLYKNSPICTVDQHLLLKLKNVKTSRRTNDVTLRSLNVAHHVHPFLPKSINAQLSSVLATAQEEARSNLQNILGSVKYLAQQGLALRGHGNEEGNFHYLLLLKAEDDPALGHWLKWNHSYTSPVVQNEMLSLMSNTIIRNIAEEILALPVVQYSVIIDGTQDVSDRAGVHLSPLR